MSYSALISSLEEGGIPSAMGDFLSAEGGGGAGLEGPRPLDFRSRALAGTDFGEDFLVRAGGVGL